VSVACSGLAWFGASIRCANTLELNSGYCYYLAAGVGSWRLAFCGFFLLGTCLRAMNDMLLCPMYESFSYRARVPASKMMI
jgi:hypothetical protein